MKRLTVLLMQVSAAQATTGDDASIVMPECPNLRSAGGNTASTKDLASCDKDRIKGTVKKTEGSAQKTYGKAKDALRKT